MKGHEHYLEAERLVERADHDGKCDTEEMPF